MDRALLKEREKFKQRALAVPAVEKRKVKENEKAKPPKKQKVIETKPKEFDFRKAAGSSQYKFAILTKIIKHMRTRHQQGDTHPLTLDEILDETNQLDVNARIKHWLCTEALNNNPKIEVDNDAYKYKPKYNFKDKKSLMKFLDRQDQQGLGGILMDDVEEAVPIYTKVLKKLGDRIIYVERPVDKKKVLFYNDKSIEFKVDEELQKLWRASTVESMDERKIEDYLEKHGISSMQNSGAKVTAAPKRKPNRKRNRQFKTHNNHLAGVLQDFSEPSAT